jgi:hypothetical protein
MADQYIPITIEEVTDPEELAQARARCALCTQLRLVTSACHRDLYAVSWQVYLCSR